MEIRKKKQQQHKNIYKFKYNNDIDMSWTPFQGMWGYWSTFLFAPGDTYPYLSNRHNQFMKIRGWKKPK